MAAEVGGEWDQLLMAGVERGGRSPRRTFIRMTRPISSTFSWRVL